MVLSINFRTILLCIYFCFFFCTFASENETNPDIRSASLGSINALSREFINPAYLSFHLQPQVGISVINRFGIKELNTYNLYGLIPNKFLDAGVKISRYGYSDFSILTTKISFSKKVFDRISFGSNLYYISEQLDFENQTHKIYKADIGSYCHLSENANIALLIKNVASNYSYNKPVLHGGLDYMIIPSFRIAIEIASDCKHFFNLMSGFEYEMMNHFYIRAGIRTNPGTPSFGIGYSFNRFTIDYTFSNHQQLGNSNSIGITHQF